MRMILILGLSVLALTACGPAKMGTRNEKRGPQVKSKTTGQEPTAPSGEPSPTLPGSEDNLPAPETTTPEASIPQQESTPAPSPARAPSPSPENSRDGQKASTQPVGEAAPVAAPSTTSRIFDPSSENATPTCAGNECTMTDAGNFKTEQPFSLKPLTQKLDIIFVLDTSASMRDEHEKISREISHFIAQLSPEVSFKLGLMLAHGPGTGAKGVKVGHLFSRDGETPAIDSEEVLNNVKRDSNLVAELQQRGVQARDMEREQRKQAAREVSKELMIRMMNLPTDKSIAQGEAGLLNIYKALTGAAEKSELKRAGMLRDNAALLVVFVADEQDMCFDYSQPSLVTGTLVKGNYDTPNDKQTELSAFQSAVICGRVANGARLTPKHVFDAGKDTKGKMPMIFTGVHYISENVPMAQDKHAGDNEMGHGYLDLIKLAGGQAVDLGLKDFSKILAAIGDFSNAKMMFETNSFPIPGAVDADRLDPKSIGVIVVSPDGVDHPIPGENVKLQVNEQSKRAEVVLNYDTLEHIHKEGWAQPGAKLKIYYGYKEDAR